MVVCVTIQAMKVMRSGLNAFPLADIVGKIKRGAEHRK